jgi:iron complex outermembrane recepter protein
VEDNSISRSYLGLLNASADFNIGNMTVGLWGKNLTDKDYNAYYFKMTSGYFGQKGKPLTAGFSVSLHI